MTESKNVSISDAPSILYISPAFAPKPDSEAFCSAKFANALANAGARLVVFTCPESGMPGIDDSMLWQTVGYHVADFQVPTHKNPLQSLCMAARYQAQSFARWIGTAVEEAKHLHQQRPFDVVYSRSLPMFGHIAGYWCAHSLKLPWIVNINDPWDWHLFPVGDIDKTQIRATISNFWMRRTFRSAELVTYPSDRLHAYHVAVSGVQHKSIVIPHVGAGLGRYQVSNAESSTEWFNLVHAGKLGSNDSTGRSAKPLLHGLRLFLQDFPNATRTTRLTFVGPSDSGTESLVSEFGLEANVQSVGRVTYEESLRHMQAAAVCVLVEAKMGEGIFLPSKLVDYFSARKPVLALSPQVGVVNDMAKNGGIARVDSGDAEAVRKALGTFYVDFQNGTLARRAPSQEQISQFQPEILAGKFLTAVGDLDQSRKSHRENRSNSEIQTAATTNVPAK